MNVQMAGSNEETLAAFSVAHEEFEPLAGKLRHVPPQHASVLYHLVVGHLNVNEDVDRIVEYASTLLAIMSDGQLGTYEIAMVCGYLAHGLDNIGNRHKLQGCVRISLNMVLRAHHAEPEDQKFLEHLIHCYFNVRDPVRCRLAYEMFTQVDPPDEDTQMVDVFMLTRFHEIGRKLETPS